MWTVVFTQYICTDIFCGPRKFTPPLVWQLGAPLRPQALVQCTTPPQKNYNSAPLDLGHPF